MNKKYITVLLALSLAVMVTACGKVEEPIKQVNVYDKEVYEHTINIIEYEEAVEDILLAYNNSKEIIDECISKHSGLMTQNMIYKLNESVIDTDGLEIPSEMENMDNPEESDYTEDSGAITITNEDGTESLLYPIYDITGNIYDYGTLEESEESLEQIVNIPVYSVTSIDGYSDRLIATVSTRFGSNLKVVFSMNNDKLDDYTMYR